MTEYRLPGEGKNQALVNYDVHREKKWPLPGPIFTAYELIYQVATCKVDRVVNA